ncbi:MAG: hypothetical protein RL607_2036 [Bacteroidota bacterium]|jgi:hypothetical protein
MKRLLLLALCLGMSAFAQEIPKKAIQDALNLKYASLKLTASDITNWKVMSETYSESTGIHNYFICQTHNGLPLFDAVNSIWVKNGTVIQIGDSFVANYTAKINNSSKALTATEALTATFTALGYSQNTELLSRNENGVCKLKNGNLTEDPVRAELGYVEKEGQFIQVWRFEFYSPDYKNLWHIDTDASSGTIISKRDLTVSCNFHPTHVTSDVQSPVFSFENVIQKKAAPLQVLGGNYRVIPFNYESPNHSAFQLISSPENALASPKGWHDTNNLADNLSTLKYTYARGNNVWARADYSNSNPTTHATTATLNGYSPDGGSTLNFDFPYGGTSAAANTYINAAVTNLFYMNNCIHDIWYQYGFNELNGNFQQNNFGRGGTGTDFVWADAQDGSTASTPTFNNANFSTPSDGSKGRMQMYLWKVAPPIYPVTVNSPVDIAGNYRAIQNVFNPGFVSLPQAPNFIQSDIVLYQDGTGGLNEGCVAPSNGAAMNGKIVVIRRGNCNFTVKVKNAQTRGAAAVIIVNNVSDPQFVTMSGADSTITIPAITMSFDDGEALIGYTFTGPVNVKLQLNGPAFVNADGDFDNGIIAHEFGHGISNRLTGGPSLSNCLTNEEQMGEGWSDWFALMLQMKPGDVGTTPKGIGTFAVSQATTGGGIRNYPYSTDMSINPETFATVNNNYYDSNADGIVDAPESHNIGEVWCTMLWDLTWAYVAKYGYNDNKYTGTGGNNKAMRLIIDALKLQPCNPTFVEARNAIIAADQATTGGADYCMIWEVFARRGLGLNASSGNRNDSTDQVEDFTQPAPGPNCTALGTSAFANTITYHVFPNPSQNEVHLQIPNYTSTINVRVLDMNGRIVYQNTKALDNNDILIPMQSLESGLYILQATGENLMITEKIIKN